MVLFTVLKLWKGFVIVYCFKRFLLWVRTCLFMMWKRVSNIIKFIGTLITDTAVQLKEMWSKVILEKMMWSIRKLIYLSNPDSDIYPAIILLYKILEVFNFVLLKIYLNKRIKINTVIFLTSGYCKITWQSRDNTSRCVIKRQVELETVSKWWTVTLRNLAAFRASHIYLSFRTGRWSHGGGLNNNNPVFIL